MSGSAKLSETEKAEMLEDGKSEKRRRAFRAARLASESGGLDEYVRFLSETLPLFEFRPRAKVANKNRL